MALIVSAASGNFNAGATWVGGVVPGVGDEAQAATGHTITITANVTCDLLSTPSTGNGSFVLNNGVTLNANVINRTTANNFSVLNFSSASPATASIVGNIYANSTTTNGNAFTVTNSNSGTLYITSAGGNFGGITGLNTYSSHAIRNTSSGIIHISGNCTGGSGVGNSSCVVNAAGGAIYITGNCAAGTSTGSSAGATNNSTGTLSVIGTIQASQTSAGVAGSNIQQTTILTGPFLTETTRGVSAVYCAAWRWNASPSNSTYMEVMTNDLLAKRNLVTDNNVTGMPAVTNVRSGTVYGPTSSLTGTLAVPVASSVASGVPVDNTTGTAALTPEAVWSYASRTITGGTVTTLTNAPNVPTPSAIADEVWNRQASAITTTNSIGERVKNTATTAILGNLLAQSNS